MHVSTNHNPTLRSYCGYLLLEVVLGLAIAVLILSGVFALASGSLAVSEAIADEGRTQISQETFLTFLERNFEALPGNTTLELESQERGRHYISKMTFENVPLAFGWAGQTISAEATQLATVQRQDGTLDIVLRYYEEKILDDTAESEALTADPIAELVLLRNVWRFEWKVLDGRTMEWNYDWDIKGRMPLLVQLDAVFHRDGEIVVHNFWIPPKTNPEVLINANNRMQGRTPGAGGNPGGNTGGGNTGGGTDAPPPPRPRGGGSAGGNRGGATR